MQRRTRKQLVVLFAAVAGILPVLSQPAWSQNTRATAPTATPRAAGPNVKVAAEVNSDKIMMADVTAVLERIQAQQPNIPQADLDAMRSEILEDLIIERLLVQEAKRSGLTPDKQRVDDAIWNFRKPFPNEAAYKKHLADNGRTEEELRRMLADEMAIREFSKKLTEDITVNDAEISDYYEERKPDFVVPEMVRVRHIQVSVKQDASQDERSAAERRANEALRKATDRDAKFEDIVKEYSDDKVSVAAGGDLGYIARDDIMDKAFGDAVFSAPVGKVHSKLVKTKFGFNIILVEDKRPSRTLTLAEVKDHVKPVILRQKLKARMDKRVAELMKTAKIEKFI